MAEGYIPYAYLVNEYLLATANRNLETGSSLWCKGIAERNTYEGNGAEKDLEP
jgi:hypothetical protein